EVIRGPSDKELNATRVLALPIDEASVKVRAGGPIDDDEDLGVACWAGHVPLHLAAAAPIADAHHLPKADAPVSMLAYSRGRKT
ncbi:MAG TPA: hypothetical protein VNO21_03275, partial [Polyangiaceae bacterium]|nr:hypothetical protein [Polyangiaceae bacterium]